MTESQFDVVVLGGGAAGLFCAIEAGKRGRSVLVLERSEKIGKKILISGGGRCNFTNIGARPESYISENPHFCKSSLSRYTPQDFVDLVEKHGIEYHEKKLGQLFCNDSSRQIVGMLQRECDEHGVKIQLNTEVSGIEKSDSDFQLRTSLEKSVRCNSLVVATGGISIPKMGATPFGYRVAEQFGLSVTELRPGLVPLTFTGAFLDELEGLSGISIDSEVRAGKKKFRENILITHRGVSGPAILQASSYWREREPIEINLLPESDLKKMITIQRDADGRKKVSNLFGQLLPKSFIERACERWITDKRVADLTKEEIESLTEFSHYWSLYPNGTEGYRKAEVTCGGVSTEELSQKTMESKKVHGLYFIGEVVDVTGWLGGYNFQWAWASAYSAGQVV